MFTPGISLGQSGILTDLIVNDISTGADAAITDRRIYMQLADGTYLVPAGTSTNYVDWPLSDGLSKTLNVLDIDYAITFTVQWLNSGGGVLYFISLEADFPSYANYNGYNLTQLMAANPSIVNKSDFFANYTKLWAYIQAANNAIAIGADIATSQQALNNASRLFNSPNVFFK